jgi:flagellar biosynthetic protein FlhB
MSDSGERTEEPTGRRIDKAREEGQVARSQEVAAAAVLITALLSVVMSSQWLIHGFEELFRSSFSFDKKTLMTPGLMVTLLGEFLLQGLGYLLPLLLMTAAVALLASVASGGFIFSVKAIGPHFHKLDPAKGLQRIFGANAWLELGKAILKFSVVTIVLIIVLKGRRTELMQLGHMALEPALAAVGKLLLESSLWVSLSLVLIAAVDVPLQRYRFFKNLRMTKQEIKDEMKEAEGRPEVRAQIRRRQRELATQKMMQRLKDADVIITNPEHFAVALSYDPSNEAPPFLIAKGIDHLAYRIRDEANLQGITIFEAPPLARALYFTTELEHPVPEELYFAVAQVIAFVFSLADIKPGAPTIIPPTPRVPASMHFDENGHLVG